LPLLKLCGEEKAAELPGIGLRVCFAARAYRFRR
jgi:hypothetical protein